jgi:hypothetical protein
MRKTRPSTSAVVDNALSGGSYQNHFVKCIQLSFDFCERVLCNLEQCRILSKKEFV